MLKTGLTVPLKNWIDVKNWVKIGCLTFMRQGHQRLYGHFCTSYRLIQGIDIIEEGGGGSIAGSCPIKGKSWSNGSPL